jgi:F-type H+-transporting ATPase subunit a
MAQIAPEVIFHIGSFPITNTDLNTIVVDALIIGSIIYLNKNLTKIPGLFQNIMETVIELLYDLTESVSGKHTKIIFPFFFSFFIFILIINWSGIIPGNGSLGLKEGNELVPVFRNATSDLNLTLALTIISLAVTHFFAIKTVGIKDYLGRYFSLNPLNLFVGLLEIVSEVTKLISLSFRLFGNIFAGEVLLLTIGSLFAFILPIPFIALEILIGLIQAMVFSMLTMVFMAMLMTSHNAEGV